VASGILASRLIGLVRQRVFLHYLGTSGEADAFTAAFRVPNVLQNLLGEGVLSASFIPVYARLRERGDDSARQAVAGAVLGLLSLLAASLVLLGILVAPWLIEFLLPGFSDAQQNLTVRLARILFAGAGLFVVSAWCLGILNSHRKFILSYASPVAWNVAMIAGLLWQGGAGDPQATVIVLAWASVVGSALQVAIQWPAVRAVLGELRISLGRRTPEVRTVIRNFVPALIGRGSAQVSAYVDAFIASFLMTGSMTILANAQTLYMLPVSLFGMSITASELPAMSGDAGAGEPGRARLRERLSLASRRVAFLVVPSAVAFVVLGDAIVALVFQGGRFGPGETVWLWGTLSMAAVGLVAATTGRLYASALFALEDARTPQRIALIRLALGAALGAGGALWATRAFGLAEQWRIAALALGSSAGAWVEFGLLRRQVSDRVGLLPPPNHEVFRVWIGALTAAVASLLLRWLGVEARTPLGGATHCLAFAAVYGIATAALGVAQARALVGTVFRR
jgi:putative peptidoglycan lipid II flippase